MAVIYFQCEVVGATAGPKQLHPRIMMSWFRCLLSVNNRLGWISVLGGSRKGREKATAKEENILHFGAETN